MLQTIGTLIYVGLILAVVAIVVYAILTLPAQFLHKHADKERK